MNLADQIDQEDREDARMARQSERNRAHAASLEYERHLKEKYALDPDFFIWNPNRALDLQNFDHQFFHRQRFSEPVKRQLEIVAAKITHIRRDGQSGYFNKLEKNVGWTRHITPLIRCRVAYVDKLVRCNIWSHSGNSGRCHKPDCPCCHWNDILKVQVEAFGIESRTFERMQQRGLTPWFITLSFTTNPANSRAVGRDFQDKDISHRRGEPQYDPYPVRLGLDDDNADLPYCGYLDGKILGMVAQQAMEKVYNNSLLAGYHFKIEGAFKLVPGGANRVNIHVHAFANGDEAGAQILANALMKAMRAGLRRYRKHLHGDYFPNVLVLRLTSAEQIECVVKYSEKVVPFGLIVEEALARPEAKLEDGSWNPLYVDELETALLRLVNEDIPAIFTGSADRLFECLRRRKTVGNMRFNDRDTCIGHEPEWHKKARRKKAKKQKERRLKKKRRREEMEAEYVPHPKRQRRTRASHAGKGAKVKAGGRPKSDSKTRKKASRKRRGRAFVRRLGELPSPIESG